MSPFPDEHIVSLRGSTRAWLLCLVGLRCKTLHPEGWRCDLRPAHDGEHRATLYGLTMHDVEFRGHTFTTYLGWVS